MVSNMKVSLTTASLFKISLPRIDIAKFHPPSVSTYT